MNTLANLEKPPFFTALYLTPEKGSNEGLYSEAVSVMLSLATVLSGFIGFRDDRGLKNREVRIVLWKDYPTMIAWDKTARDLAPYQINIEDCIASRGCLWQWLEDGREENNAEMIKAA